MLSEQARRSLVNALNTRVSRNCMALQVEFGHAESGVERARLFILLDGAVLTVSQLISHRHQVGVVRLLYSVHLPLYLETHGLSASLTAVSQHGVLQVTLHSKGYLLKVPSLFLRLSNLLLGKSHHLILRVSSLLLLIQVGQQV